MWGAHRKMGPDVVGMCEKTNMLLGIFTFIRAEEEMRERKKFFRSAHVAAARKAHLSVRMRQRVHSESVVGLAWSGDDSEAVCKLR